VFWWKKAGRAAVFPIMNMRRRELIIERKERSGRKPK
jgi:hypothetical protein